MERQKLLASEWQEADGRRRKYYRLTAVGKRTLAEKKAEWERFAKGVSGVLGLTYGLA
jgi:DNA-binding PadR family transcriptional regulator